VPFVLDLPRTETGSGKLIFELFYTFLFVLINKLSSFLDIKLEKELQCNSKVSFTFIAASVMLPWKPVFLDAFEVILVTVLVVIQHVDVALIAVITGKAACNEKFNKL
jgi:hypothetical protein